MVSDMSSAFSSLRRSGLLWRAFWRVLQPLRPACSRSATFLWLIVPPGRLVQLSLLYRTHSPQKPPSEWVVTHALRQSWPHFLAGSSESLILKKFLASKISLQRCGYADILGLEKAA